MENIQRMITLCESMVNFHKGSKSVLADVNCAIWEAKLKNWKSLLKSND